MNVGDAFRQVEGLVMVSGSESALLWVLLLIQARLWGWELGTVPAAELKVDQSASVLIHASAEHLLLRR